MSRALVISQHFPSDNGRFSIGVVQRLGLFVTALSRVADEVHCLFLVRDEVHIGTEAIETHQTRLRQRWAPNLTLELKVVPRPQAGRWAAYGSGMFALSGQEMAMPFSDAGVMVAIADAFGRGPDLVFVQRLGPMSAVVKLPSALRAMPVFFDLDDVEHISLFRRLSRSPDWPSERLKLLQIPALVVGERRAIRCSSTTFVCSSNDRQHLQKWLAVDNVGVVRNAVQIPEKLPEAVDEPTVLFVGTFGYAPNVVAARALIQQIFPLIRHDVPDASLIVVGSGPERLGISAVPAGVTLAGYVQDLGATYARARVVCCPIRSGSGTRIKIIEAAGYGKAIVSTTLGAEGIDLEPQHEIVLAESDADLAAACVDLLRHPVKAAALGAAARGRARSTHDRSAVVGELVDELRSLLDEIPRV